MRHQGSMRRLVLAGFGCILGVPLRLACAAEVTHTWQGGTSCTTPMTAANWSVDGNWVNGTPNGADAIAVLASPAQKCYVTNLSSVSVFRFEAGGTATAPALGNWVYVSDAPLVVKSAGKHNQGLSVYAPLSFASGGQSYLRMTDVCGDLSFDGSSSVLFHSGTTAFRYDRYATAAGAERVVGAWPNRVDTYAATLDFYAPESSPSEVVCTFDQTAGSPCLRRVGGNVSTPLSVGAAVSGAGIPAGAFLKRVFPDKEWIELSVPVANAATGNPLSISGFSPRVFHRIANLRPNGAAAMLTIRACKYAADDEFVLDIDALTLYPDSAKAVRFACVPGRHPATVAIHSTTDLATRDGRVQFGTCELLFSDSSRAAGPGLPYAIAGMTDATSVARLSVTGEMAATVHRLENYVGTLVKIGTGSLEVGLAAAANPGSLDVRSGTFSFTCEDAAVISVGALSVGAGAVLKIPPQGLSASSVALEPGAVLVGPGKLSCGGATALDGVILRGDVQVSFATQGEVVAEVPRKTPAQLGIVPAFWIDCSNTNTMTFATKEGRSERFVSRVNDVRPDGLLFATNVSNGVRMPYMLYWPGHGMDDLVTTEAEDNAAYGLCFEHSDPGTAVAADSGTLAWSEPIFDIRAVFQVVDAKSGGGQFLGSTSKARVSRNNQHHYNDFTSDGFATRWAGKASKIVHSSANACVTGGRLFVNGVERPVLDACYPYGGYESTVAPLGHHGVPLVLELDPVLGTDGYAAADSFDFNCVAANRNGKKILCEILVYTNEVSEADRVVITEYLMKKWNNSHVVCFAPGATSGTGIGSVSGAVGGGVDVAEDCLSSLSKVTGSANFVKTGEGELYVRDLADADSSVTVSGGTLNVNSTPYDETVLPRSCFLHLDASATNTLTRDVQELANGVLRTNVTEWADVRGAGHPVAALKYAASTNRPQFVERALNGLPAVSFGKMIGTGSDLANAVKPTMKFSETTNEIRTVLGVWGSNNGGGSILSGLATSWNGGKGLRRGNTTFGANADDPIVYGALSLPMTTQTSNGDDALRFRLNGKTCDPRSTGFGDGKWDTFSYVGYEPLGCAGLSGTHYERYVGGEEIAEYLLFTEGLSDEDLRRAEAYLRWKWFGVETEGYRPARLNVLTLGDQTNVKVSGGGALTMNGLSLSGSATAEGRLNLSSEAVLEVVVAEDGTLAKLTVEGAVDLSGGGTVRIVGAVRMLNAGEYAILKGDAVASGGVWNVDPATLPRNMDATLYVAAGELRLKISKTGMILIFR